MEIFIDMCTWEGEYTHMFPCFVSWEGMDNIPVATSSLGIQILVSNTILLQKEAGILEEMADSRTGAAHIQGEIRASCSAIK